MPPADGSGRVLAIAVDAAEATLVRRLVAAGAMPALGALLQRGRWSRVESSAWVGSGSVWPTFFTGSPPAVHGAYSEWLWDPDAMATRRYDGKALTPFWAAVAAGGRRVGLLDVPLAPYLGLDEGFEISEWGAHDVIEGRTRAAPTTVADLVATGIERHPFTAGGAEGLGALADAARRGIALRGDLVERLLERDPPELTIVTFTELHHASHLLWHTVDRGDSPVVDLYRAVDAQIGRLVDVIGEGASVVVFALHGMRPTQGIVAALPRFLQAEGHAEAATWAGESWRERSLAAFGALKRRSPEPLRALYNRVVGHSLRVSLAQPTMIEPLDWSRTAAFALPTDQHGWVRVNLEGREAAGVVAVATYDSLCDAVEEGLRGLSAADGRPMVADVLRTAGDAGAVPGNRLPDLVVHWLPAAHGDGLPPSVIAPKLTGQHAGEGFLVAAGPVAALAAEVVTAETLHEVLVAPLG